MTTVNVSNLTGAALDWAVAKCEGVNEEAFMLFYDPTEINDLDTHGYPEFHYSTIWAQGGPIIDRVDMQFWKWGGNPREEMQCATLPTKEEYGTRLTTYFGKTKLVAGLRAYVASKLGGEVDVPEELL